MFGEILMVTALIASEILSVAYLFLVIIGILSKKKITDSSKALLYVCVLCIITTAADVACYTITGPNVPDILIYFFYFIAYVLGTSPLIFFTNYIVKYISEKTTVSSGIIIFSWLVLSIDIIYVLYMFMIGEVVHIENGTATLTGGMPAFATIIQLFFVILFPVVAIVKRKKIGAAAVCIIALFSVGPFIAMVLALRGAVDFSFPAGDFVVIIAYVILENGLSLELEEKRQNALTSENDNLLAITEEQETQLEEIMVLNKLLRDNASHLETRYNIIKSLTSVYFVSFYIDIKGATYITLSDMENAKDVVHHPFCQDDIYYICDKYVEVEHQEKMREFLNLETIDERLRNQNAIACKYCGTSVGWCMAYLIAGDRDENGRLMHIFFASRSIREEQKREEEQIKKLEEINAIVANADLGIWHIILKDGKRPRFQVNMKMREILALPSTDMSEEDIYDYWYERIDESGIDSVNASVKEMIDGKFSENTYIWNHPTLGERYERCGGFAKHQEDGSTILSGYHSDVTQMVRQEEKSRQELAKAKKAADSANVAKTTFLLNMSHDIRTPLNAIIGYTELVIRNADDEEKFKEYTRKIKSSGDFLLALVNHVLDMARIESGKTVIKEEAKEAANVLSEVFVVYYGPMKEKGIEFTYDYGIRSEYLYVDSVKLREIFMNLISNAMKYTDRGGRVHTNFRELPHEKEGYTNVQIEVIDTGIGMSKEFIPLIFDEFTREQSSTDNKISGTGLGMAIVKKYVDLMGGTIEVESELGKGTTITVTLPHRIATAADVLKPIDEKASSSDFAGKRVLLAEDNELNAEIAREILRGVGFEVNHAIDGIECVDMIKRAEPDYYDLILMDIQMPNMDGYEATVVIRSLDDDIRSSIPIVAMTANAFDEDRKRALSVGMNEHLTKPIDIKRMMSVLKKILYDK